MGFDAAEFGEGEIGANQYAIFLVLIVWSNALISGLLLKNAVVCFTLSGLHRLVF